jgi:hypothetical protein
MRGLIEQARLIRVQARRRQDMRLVACALVLLCSAPARADAVDVVDVDAVDVDAAALRPAAATPRHPPASASGPIAAMPSYSASGTHQCGSGSDHANSCVVTGFGFPDCIGAASSLRAQDCCPTARKGATSTGFTLNYCIPETGLGR